jgi:hypothetical protein
LQQPHDAKTINQDLNDTATTKATPGLKDELERVLKALQNRMKLALDGASHSTDNSSSNYIGTQSSSKVVTAGDDSQQTALVDLPKRRDGLTVQPRQETSLVSIPAIEQHDNDVIGNIRRRPLVVFPALPASAAPVFQSPPLSWFAMPLIRRVDA